MDAPQDTFLDLPENHGIWVYDIVHFSSDGTPEYTCKDYTTGAGTMLVSKIIDALRNWGEYTNYDVHKVGGLVERNLATCHSLQVNAEVNKITGRGTDLMIDGNETTSAKHWDIPRLTVDLMLKGLLEQGVMRDSVVHMNSNEPVLFINMDQLEPGRMDAAARDMLNYVVNIATTDLQHKWNILPVRVYAGDFLPRLRSVDGDGDQNADHAFSITLLNVVNTDIGGPSMPQLLDAPCGAPEWKRCVRKEVWRGTGLVSFEGGHADRGQLVTAVAADRDNASERSLGSERDDNESVGSDALSLAILRSPRRRRANTPQLELEPEPEHQFAREGDSDKEEVPAIDITQQDVQVLPQNQAVAADEIDGEDIHEQDIPQAGTQEQPVSREIEWPERHIEHPTWDRHDDSTSLLDLIRSQASLIAPFGTETGGHGIADIEGDVSESKSVEGKSSSSFEDVGAAVAEPDRAQARSLSDDEFVVI